jgi:hypothetical protein
MEEYGEGLKGKRVVNTLIFRQKTFCFSLRRFYVFKTFWHNTFFGKITFAAEDKIYT